MIDPRLAAVRQRAADIVRRRQYATSKPWRQGMFEGQLAVIDDPSPRVAVTGNRRGGKSHGIAGCLYEAAHEFPGKEVAFLALTRESGERIIWQTLHGINDRHKLGVQFRDHDLEAKLPNGSTIFLTGADQKNWLKRLRGGSFPLVAITEAAFFNRELLSEIIKDTIRPAQMDFGRRARVLLDSTPGYVCDGYFYEAVEAGQRPRSERGSRYKGGHGFSVHFLDVHHNPYVPDADDFIRGEMEAEGYTAENPTFRREYLGEWVHDPHGLVYRYTDASLFDALPAGPSWQYVLSLDLGTVDATAIGLTAYSAQHPDSFLVWAEAHHGATITTIGNRLVRLVEEGLPGFPGSRRPGARIADTGGLGRMVVDDLNDRFPQLAFEAAQKTEKRPAIEFVNGDFVDRRYWIHRSLTDVQHQMRVLSWTQDGKENPTQPNDLCDAALYGHRYSRHFRGKVPADKPKDGTPEALEAYALAMEDQAAAEEARGETTEWWE